MIFIRESLIGFILVCMGIQFAINGVKDLVLNTGSWKM